MPKGYIRNKIIPVISSKYFNYADVSKKKKKLENMIFFFFFIFTEHSAINKNFNRKSLSKINTGKYKIQAETLCTSQEDVTSSRSNENLKLKLKGKRIILQSFKQFMPLFGAFKVGRQKKASTHICLSQLQNNLPGIRFRMISKKFTF